MSSFTKAVISFKIIIVRSTEFVNALEQAIFPTLLHKAPQFLCNLTVSSSREDMSQSESSVPFNKERNPCPHCGVALSVSEFCKLCTINKAARPANQGRACCYFWSRLRPKIRTRYFCGNWHAICPRGDLRQTVGVHEFQESRFVIVNGDGIYKHFNKHGFLGFQRNRLFP